MSFYHKNNSIKVLITGINSQDGSYLAEYLLAQKNYKIFGGINKNSQNFNNILHIKDKINFFDYNLSDDNIYSTIQEIKPDEIYHLASSSFVSYDEKLANKLLKNNTESTFKILDAIKNYQPNCRFFLAGSSEMFGLSNQSPQNENSLFNPQNFYGISKLKAFEIVKEFRSKFNLFACCGILYNHESPRRNSIFLTRKISQTVAKIYLGLTDKIELGDIESSRDFGHAKDYVEAMFLMINNNLANDYIISSSNTHKVKDILKIAFEYINLDYKNFLRINPDFIRPSPKVQLVGDNSKIKNDLKWQPKYSIKEIIHEMIENDIVMIKTSNKIT